MNGPLRQFFDLIARSLTAKPQPRGKANGDSG
ncbi:hypothetical protein PF005_g6541 [Phytophthora fragariae]|uniref:Uncharacterized protein n=2 Tax=Phytophthora TaxID=4783 RepID=A0A6A3YPP6_9STRA|nr:hypothetical protein PF003_g27478 [Phytophthora fragariae]KAE9032773.1 hypothetical protein PR002_g9010 [Phytophthora rubi]KAE8942934.1 hypothetical protein PF009_g7318 [Phytophthora fragariae]KAE9124757.1 hypothetical protein PF010_g5886 [Phytophthora fragariae]KAE9150615.1 hypothetical protein PF006_g5015 [Phytophthora fragariae]